MYKILSVMATHHIDRMSSKGSIRLLGFFLRLTQPFKASRTRQFPRAKNLRLALQELGPIFVKFGQVLSTRRDLLPVDLADELALLQDKVEPFPGIQARQQIEKELGAPIAELYKEFDQTPLASASVAQVHKATMNDGTAVVVKVIRPGIARVIRKDIELLLAVAGLAGRVSEEVRRVKPREMVHEFERTIYDELDMQREASNASILRQHWLNSPDLYIPEIYWSHTHDKVMTMERITGIPIGDMDALRAAKVNLEELAIRGVRIFYTQVFRDNLFHADMHPGNIFVDASNPEKPVFIALDFGIVGSLSTTDQRYIAENFAALFERDYRRVAELHIEAGWVPASTRLDELESATRAVCEPQLSRPLAEISFGELLFKLFEVAKRFELEIQPQLIMLQKTLLNVEGLGRTLYPQLDAWEVAKPILKDIMRKKYGPRSSLKQIRKQLPLWLEQAPEMPGLIHTYLSQTKPTPKTQAQKPANNSKIARAIFASALTIPALFHTYPLLTAIQQNYLSAGLIIIALGIFIKR
ncbi:MAG: ubiquinone biosynthesis regulatory protein kinase UbiB [bacterium]